MKRLLIIIFFFCLCLMHSQVFSQITGANEVRKGNDEYKLGRFEQAEARYRKSLTKGVGSVEGEFNLANSLYKQKKYKESAAMFKSIAESEEDKELKSKAFYNLGNSLIEMQEYQGGVDAYKNALRLNPDDDEARKNLLYAMNKLKEEEEKKQDKQDDKQDQENKDQNKDQEQQKNQDQEQKEQEQKEQKQNEQNQKQQEEQQNQQQQQQQPEMSKEEAQRMLDALNNDEKEIQDKLKKKKVQGNPKKIEKDW